MGRFSLYNDDEENAAPSPSVAPSSAAGGEGGGLPTTETMAIGPSAFGLGKTGAGPTSFGGVQAVDKAKMIEDMATKAWRERRTAAGQVDPDTALQWWTEEQERARQQVEQNLPQDVPVADLDPSRIGAAMRAVSEVAPERFTEIPLLGGVENPLQYLDRLPGGLAVEQWAGRNIIAPVAAFSRGMEESLTVPVEDGLYEEGPLTYNETGQGLGLDKLARLSPGTFISTAAAGGLERWEDGGWEDTGEWGDWTQWSLPRLMAATASGWGSPEHLRNLERGHETMSLRDDLDLGKLATPATLFADPVGRTLFGEEEWESAKNLGVAFALSLADPDVFMGIGAASRGGADVFDAGKAALLGLKPKEGVLGEGFLKMAEAVGVDGTWGVRAAANDMLQGVRAGLAELEVLAETMSHQPKTARWEVNRKVHEIADSLPKGAREIFLVSTKAISALNAHADANTLKAIRAAQQAEERMRRHYDDVVGQIRSGEDAVRQAEHDVASLEQVLHHLKQAGTPKERKAARATLRSAKKDLSVKTRVLEYTRARTKLVAAEHIVKNLEEHKAALERLAQVDGVRATSKEADAARQEVYDAFQTMVGADMARHLGGGPDADDLFEAAAKNYRQVSLDAVARIGRGAETALDAELAASKAQLKDLRKQYVVAERAALRAVPESTDFGKDLRKVVRAHKRALDAVAKAASQTDADQVLLGSAIQALRNLKTGLRGVAGKTSVTDVERALGAQALSVAHTMTYRSKTEAGRVLQGITELVKEIFLPQGAVKRAFGGTSDLTAKAGKMVLSGIQMAQKDMLQIAQGVDPARQGSALVRYLDTTETFSGSVFNTVSERSIFRDAVPVLRAALASGEHAGKALEGVAFMFYQRGKEAPPNVKAALRKDLQTILTWGSTKIPKGKKEKEAAKAAVRRMTADQFFLKFYKASLSRQTDPQLMGWVDKFADGTPRAGISDLITPEAMQLGRDMGVSEAALLRTKNELERALARGTQAMVHAAITSRVGMELAAVTEASLPAMQAIRKVGDVMHHDAGQAFSEAASVFDKLGMQVTSRKVRQVGKDVAAGIAVFADPEGEGAGLIPRAFLDRMDERIGSIVNSDEFFSANDVTAPAKAAAYGLARAIQTSMLTGILLPKPRYFTNIYVGNFGQMWVTAGMGPAFRVTADSLVSRLPAGATARIPGVGQLLDRARFAMAERLGIPRSQVPPTLTSTLVNPYVDAVLDTAKAGFKDLVPDRFGRGHSYGEVRKAMWEEGVFQTFAHTSPLARLGQRTDNWKALNRMSESEFRRFFKGDVLALSEKWADMADALEQRQRIALFLDLVFTEGHSFEEAGSLVRKSLYDWNHPNSLLEAEWAVKLFFFWNFRRRALEQGIRTLASPALETEGSSVLGAAIQQNTVWSAMLGKKATSLARARDLAKTYDTLKHASRDEDTAEAYPWWNRTQAQQVFLTNQDMGPEMIDAYARRGIEAHQFAYSVTNGTPLESISELTHMAGLILGWARPEDQSAFEATMRHFADMGGFLSKDAMEGVLDATFGPEWVDHGHEWKAIKSPTDAIMFRTLDAILAANKWHPIHGLGMDFLDMDGAFVRAGEDGGLEVKRSLLAFKTILPVVGSEFKQLDSLFVEAKGFPEDPTARDAVEAIGRVLGNLTGAVRSYAYSSDKVIKDTEQYEKRAAKKAEKEEQETAERVEAMWETGLFGDQRPAGKTAPAPKKGGGRLKKLDFGP